MCQSVPCYLKNNRPVIDAVEKELGIGPGQTSHDGVFSLQMVNCIGACDLAPAMMIDDTVFGDVTPERVTEILAGYR
jgi:NADH:ubiquinone oxidoreductase subunit E